MDKMNLDALKQIEGLSKRLAQVSREIAFSIKQGLPKRETNLLRKEMNEIYEELFALKPGH